jgi:hypothetical protein
MKTILLGTAAAAALAIGTVQAAPLSGSFSFFFTRVVSDTSSLVSGSEINFTAARTDSGAGDFLTLPFNLSLTITPKPFTVANASPINFTLPGWGSFLGTASGYVPGTDESSFRVLGIFTPDAMMFPSASATPSDVTISFTQTGGPGRPISATGTFDTEPSPIPTPMALALFGVGLAGLGLVARRRG